MAESTLINVAEVVAELRRLGNPENVAGMARFGVTARQALGLSAGQLRALAKRIGRNHDLAGQLWATGIFEARILAALIGEPGRLTRQQARAWTRDFESWADCDGVCLHLFRKAPFAHEFAVECSRRKREFVKRTGFTLMATLAVHDKAASEKVFLDYLPRLERAAHDERNGVKKAVNWALRQIGQRDPRLQRAAIRTAESIRQQGTPAAKWIASDALRELGRFVPRKAKARPRPRRASGKRRGLPAIAGKIPAPTARPADGNNNGCEAGTRSRNTRSAGDESMPVGAVQPACRVRRLGRLASAPLPPLKSPLAPIFSRQQRKN